MGWSQTFVGAAVACLIAAGVFAATGSIALAMVFFGLAVALTVAAVIVFARVRRAEERAKKASIGYKVLESMRRRREEEKRRRLKQLRGRRRDAPAISVRVGGCTGQAE
jgi:high-affinity Fe2+/Pb2+ permease